MNLWVRSQDKTIFQIVDNLLISDGNNAKGTFNIYTNSLLVQNVLGEYKTKERAIEVLDEIQNILKPQLIIKNSGKIIGSFEDTIVREGATYELKELSTFVYQMPEK